ncbi:pitrilysin family protein [Helicobacter sp. MIT 21-1697]|uniref:M16 family metallopeptidase n=1 Tax=Helicobacter sp. MIT 21-1697 TaxID=2993733 RepID=UPI00224B4166|nr:pitrilysin family protein [Helicobacter sp. MIT 21-1697]MCX2717767.1 pitrilysin family protein [Helicobacter sp. MIT 21-1697]
MNAQEARVSAVEINGVSVPLIFEQSKNLPVGDVQLVFIGGRADAQKAGLGALSAKMLNEGTKTLGSVDFARKLEQKAIGLYASVGLQTLSFELSYLKEFEDESFSLLQELLYDPNLTLTAFEKVKSLILSRLVSQEDDFDNVAQRNLNTMLFKDTPMAVPLLGDKQSIESITLEDVEVFLKRNLVLKRLIIIAGGDMQEEQLKTKLASALGVLPVGESKEKLHFKASHNADSINVQKPTQQAFIYFGSPFDVKDSHQNYMARVMSFILGGSGFGSRMMEEVRVKRGLAYSAYMKISVGGAVDYASGYLQTKLENKDKAIEVVKEVVNDFIAQGASEQELAAAKAFLLGSEPLREESLSQRLGAKFVNYFRDLPLDNHKKELELIKTLTLEELNAYIKSHKEILQMSFSVVEQSALPESSQ